MPDMRMRYVRLLSSCRCSDPTLVAVVVPRVRRRRARDARDRTQIFIHGPEVVVSHVLESEPWHYLEKSAVEWSRDAVCVDDARWTGRMEASWGGARLLLGRHRQGLLRPWPMLAGGAGTNRGI